ncbi:MAG: ribosome maturation factor RimP [Firmicutes bacterium]|nr:ribosome maturation factor RimP [Bacillota bacterium]
MAKKKINETIAEIAEAFLKNEGLELYNVEFVKEGKDWFLRVYIDKLSDDTEEYVSTDECEKVSRFLSNELDRLDPIEQNYYLEVSSPGMDRQLIEPKHYAKYAGKLVEVKLYRGVNGKKLYEGVLVGLIDNKVVIKDENENELAFDVDQVAKTNLAVVF